MRGVPAGATVARGFATQDCALTRAAAMPIAEAECRTASLAGSRGLSAAFTAATLRGRAPRCVCTAAIVRATCALAALALRPAARPRAARAGSCNVATPRPAAASFAHVRPTRVSAARARVRSDRSAAGTPTADPMRASIPRTAAVSARTRAVVTVTALRGSAAGRSRSRTPRSCCACPCERARGLRAGRVLSI